MMERFEVGLDEFQRSLPTSAQSRANCKTRSGLCGSFSLFHVWGKQICFLLIWKKIWNFQMWNMSLLQCVPFHAMCKCSIFHKQKFFYFGQSYPFLHSELLFRHLPFSSLPYFLNCGLVKQFPINSFVFCKRTLEETLIFPPGLSRRGGK